jgi:hypothetical protein
MTLRTFPIVLFYREGPYLCRVYSNHQYTSHQLFRNVRWQDVDFAMKNEVIREDFCEALHERLASDCTTRLNVV